MRRGTIVIVSGLLVAAPNFAAAAAMDDVATQLDSARAAVARGDGLRTLEAIQAAAGTLTAKLVEQYSRVLPPSPTGWDASQVSSQPLDDIGGGLTISRGFQKGEAALNAMLVIDNPAVTTAASLFQAGTTPPGENGWSKLKVGSEDAMLRFDAANREGEIVMVVQGRALLQVEGTEIATPSVLTDLAKGWGLAALRKLLTPS